MANTSDRIQLLPEHIIDQIKAGEVIERPSSLLKEVIENSLDAGARNINVTIKDNGLTLIGIEDDGRGIQPHDLPLAFCRHATSKISTFEDVYRLGSFGFRGEALASIASISRITCETSTDSNKSVIKIEGGETKTQDTVEMNQSLSGTKLFIKDLFFNTPVRMKFIKSQTSEKNNLKKILKSFLLANPQTEFRVQWDDQEKEIYKAYSERADRISDVLKIPKEDFYSEIYEYDGITCHVNLSKNSNRGNAHKQHFIFINNRYIQDIQIHKIVLNCARAIWPEGETGHYILFLEIPADEIDINIHPSKTQIKFFQAPKVFSVISGVVNQLVANIKLTKPEALSDSAVQPQMLMTPKEVQYREFHFHGEQDVQNYFDQLHSPSDQPGPPENTSTNVLANFAHIVLLQQNTKLYSLHKLSFYKKHFLEVLNSKDIKDDTIPLMVSKPIDLKTSFSPDRVDHLLELGFEIDVIGKETALLRSFPRKLQIYPYLKFVQYHINLSSQDIRDNIEWNFLDQFEMAISTLIKEMSFYNIPILLADKILTPVTEKHFLDLHE